MEYLAQNEISCAIFMGNPMSKEERSVVINKFRKSNHSYTQRLFGYTNTSI